MNPIIKQHIVDFFKGLIAAMAASALMAGIQYIGAHIPDLLQNVATVAAAIGGVKTGR